MELLLFLHRGLAQALVLYFAILGVWGLLAWRRGEVTPSYVGSLVIAEGAAVLQTVLGLALTIERPLVDAIHALYGISIVLALPLAYAIARDRSVPHQALTYALASFFAAGLAIRGIDTA